MASSKPEKGMAVKDRIESWKKVEEKIERLESENEELMSNIPQQPKNSDVAIIENNIQHLKAGIKGVSSLQGRSKTSQKAIAKHLENIKGMIEELRCSVDEISKENTAANFFN